MDIKTISSAANMLGKVQQVQQKPTAEAAFANMVKNTISEVTSSQKAAEAMTAAAANGENVPMHEVIQAISKAELTLQTMTTVRDKAVEAYQEILRMPI